MRWDGEADDKRMELAVELAKLVLGKEGLHDRGVRSEVIAAAFKTLLPSRHGHVGVCEKWVDHTIEVARMVQSDFKLFEIDQLDLLTRFLGDVESADGEKQRVIAEILAGATGALETEKPATALRAFGDSVGRKADELWDGVTRREDGEIVAIKWNNLRGVLSSNFNLPYLTELDLKGYYGLTAPPGCPRGASWDFIYDADGVNRLRSWFSATPGTLMGGAFGDEVKEGKDGNEANEGKEGHGVATEMEALRAFAESVGFKGDIMDGVATQCAGGAIEEIHWMN